MNQDQKDAAKLEDDILNLLSTFEQTHPHLQVSYVTLERIPIRGLTNLQDVEVEIILK